MIATSPPPTHPPAARRGWWAVVRSALSALAGVAVLAAFLAWMGGAFRTKVRPGEVPAERPSGVGRQLVPAVRERVPETATVAGSVQPRQRTEVSAQLLATIRDVTVRPGEPVWPGRELVLLDDSRLRAQLGEAQAAVVAAEADLVVRRKDFEFATAQRDKGVLSPAEFSRFEGAMKVAEAQVVRAREAVSQLNVQLSYTRITAAAKGVVGDRFADPGSVAAPGKTLLVLYDPAELEFHADVPETLAPAVYAAARDRTPLRVRVEAGAIDGSGTVTEVVPQTRPGSRSILVKMALPAATGRTPLAGMFGRVELPIPGRAADRVYVPAAAVRQVGQLDLVEVADPDGTLTRRFVRPGESDGDRVEILSGLTGGERVALPSN